MITINSLSGGKTSSYLAVHYPANYHLFALVRTNHKSCMFPDKKVRQIVSDKIGTEFIGTLEMDNIVYTMLDLEQFTGKEIVWISPITFEESIQKHGNYLPNIMTRYCTTDIKVQPIAQWCYDNTELPVEMRIGFRCNEMSRAKTMLDKEIDGYEQFKFIIGKKNNRNKWKTLPYRKCKFPLIEQGIFKDQIEKYWNEHPVRFAYKNNCVGCFHRSEIFLKHMSNKDQRKFNWFVNIEKQKNCTFKNGITYDRISKFHTQLELFDDVPMIVTGKHVF